ncbi:MAG TPA: HD domain-containing phosphohydrolase, partial [Actinomycetota bacterium]|nr:HD domain-containing phosphohydrolase [Actinomycetota bacterium]
MSEAVTAQQLDAAEEHRLREQLLAFARDINEVYRRERARTAELERALDDLEESYLATVKTLAFVVEAKDTHTRSHLDRAHDYAVALASRVAPELANDQTLRYGFFLHDIGKIGIPERILSKPGPLTDDEWAIMRTHPLLGAQILSPVKFLIPALPIVEAHHEKWDGSGYPRGLRYEEIPLGARIFSLVDAFDAMTSDRPYRRALSFEQALEQISTCAGTHFDPDVVRSFIELCE